jgi:acetoin utilization protein AcuC
MTGPALYVMSPGAAGYDLGEGHPMRAIRSRLTLELATELGVMARPNWSLLTVDAADDDVLALAHTDVYVAMVRNADRLPSHLLAHIGLGTEDTPLIPDLHNAAASVVGATVAACRAVQSGNALHAVNLSGGLNHAMRGHASGFCVYNDAAVGIQSLLRAGASRVAYVDLDAHHGDGVEACFVDDPRVLTISLHQDGRNLFPGTGHAHEVGGPAALGHAVNVALPPHTGDVGWLRAFDAVVPELLRRFRPELIVTQCGCDAHARDPLTDLLISVEAFTHAYEALHDLAHELCAGRWVVLGGGGYDVGSAVPRAWTQLLAVCGGGALSPNTVLPEAWRVLVTAAGEGPAPHLLGDGVHIATRPWSTDSIDRDDPMDAAVCATLEAVLPLHDAAELGFR